MARPLRISFPGACYHVTARGNARQRICHDDRDREAFLARLEAVVLTQVSRQAGMRREETERPTPGRVSVARLAARSYLPFLTPTSHHSPAPVTNSAGHPTPAANTGGRIWGT